jgi:hypothetical protein
MEYKDFISAFAAVSTFLAVVIAIYIAKGQRKSEVVTRHEEWFERNFSLLLEQHNIQLEKLVESTSFERSINEVLYYYYAPREGDSKDAIVNASQKLHLLDDFYGCYFKVLYRLLKHIDENLPKNSYSKDGGKFYTGIVRSFIKTDILWLLAINSVDIVSDVQYVNYKHYLEKYAFFEHMILEKEAAAKTLPKIINDAESSRLMLNTLRLHQSGFSYPFIDGICEKYSEDAFGRNRQFIAYKEYKNSL